MRNIMALALGLGAASSFAQLWNNGPMVTHPGAGPGGVNVSMASLVPNSGGNNQNGSLVPQNYAVADDFTVTGAGWNVTNVKMYGYDSLAPGGVARWASVEMQIWSGMPGTGTLVATGTTSWQKANINRVFNGVASLTNTDRQIQEVTGVFNVQLSAGTYWMTQSITVATGGSAWNPYVMDINPLNANDPITRVGNAMIRNAGVWGPGTVTTGAWNQAPEHPFIVNGSPVPEPATMAALGLGALAMIRRRRNKV